MVNNMTYEIIKAKNREEALAKARHQVEGLALIRKVEAQPNGDGTYTILPYYELVERVVRLRNGKMWEVVLDGKVVFYSCDKSEVEQWLDAERESN